MTGPAALAAVALIFAEYTRAFAPLTDRQVHLVAGGLLVALTVANIRSVNWSAALQNASTITKVLVLAALSLLIFALGDARAWRVRAADHVERRGTAAASGPR